MSNINDKNNESKSRTQTIVRAVLFAVVLVASAAALISLKQLTADGPLTPEGFATRDSLQNMAHPDTTEAPDASPVSPDAAGANPAGGETPVDSMFVSGDARSPLDAGYEDGYYAGLIDGVSGDERASYDDSSQFPDAKQRQAYSDAYRRGYSQGFDEGLEGKSFSVIPDQNDDAYDDDDDEEPAPAAPAVHETPAPKPSAPAAKPAVKPVAKPAVKPAAKPAAKEHSSSSVRKSARKASSAKKSSTRRVSAKRSETKDKRVKKASTKKSTTKKSSEKSSSSKRSSKK